MVVGCYFPWLVFAVIALFCHAQDLTTVLTTPPNVMGERREFWSTEFIFQGVSIVAHTPRTSSDIDVLIGLLSSPERSDLRQAIRETFAVATWPQPHLKYHVWFVMAGCVTSDLYEEHRKYHDLLFLNVQDIFKANFSTLPIKTFGFLQLGLAAAPSVQWYMKADDDTFIAIPRLLADLSRAREQHGAEAGVYAGHIWFNAMVIRDPASKWAVSPAMWAPSNYPDYASGGAGYVLSHNLVGCSQEVVKSPEYKYFVREDIATAITINSGCDAYETRDWGSSQTIPVLESHSTSRPSEILTNKMLTVHGVKDPNLMRELWQLLCASHVGLQSRSRRVATLSDSPLLPSESVAEVSEKTQKGIFTREKSLQLASGSPLRADRALMPPNNDNGISTKAKSLANPSERLHRPEIEVLDAQKHELPRDESVLAVQMLFCFATALVVTMMWRCWRRKIRELEKPNR